MARARRDRTNPIDQFTTRGVGAGLARLNKKAGKKQPKSAPKTGPTTGITSGPGGPGF